MKTFDLNNQLEEIIENARSKGAETDVFFQTTLQRYVRQISILKDLEKAIAEHGTTITKEYVKGRKNLCPNPAIKEYNQTSTAANGTVQTLIKILDSFPDRKGREKSIAELMDGLMKDA